MLVERPEEDVKAGWNLLGDGHVFAPVDEHLICLADVDDQARRQLQMRRHEPVLE